MRTFYVLSIVFSCLVKQFICFTDFSETYNFNAYLNAVNNGLKYLKDNIYLANDSTKASFEASRWAVTVVNINTDVVLKLNPVLPQGMNEKLKTVLSQSAELMDMYRKEIWKNSYNVPDVDVISLIGLEKEWRAFTKSFKNMKRRNFNLTTDLQDQFPTLADYGKAHNVLQYTEEKLFRPCFQDLVTNVLSESKCSLDLRCLVMFTQNKFQYGLSLISSLHFFTHIRNTRHCNAFTTVKDENVVYDLCSKAFNENVYLAGFGFPFFEDIVQRITLCTLLDHPQLLNVTWLDAALERATPRGCFKGTEYKQGYYLPRRSFIYRALQDMCDHKATIFAILYLSLILQINSKEYDSEEVKYYFNTMGNAMDYIRTNYTNLNQTSALETFITMEICFKLQVYKKLSSTLRMELNNIYRKIKENLSELQSEHTEEPNCLVMLMNNPVEQTNYHNKCNLSAECLQNITNRTYNEDYGITTIKKLLYLTVSRHTRGCFIMSAIEDKEMLDEICSSAYQQIPILDNTNVIEMLQISVYCGINGHSGFLEKSWHGDFFSKQQPNGCFPNRKISLSASSKVQRRYNEECDPHATIFSITSLSLAVKYIAEVFYTEEVVN